MAEITDEALKDEFSTFDVKLDDTDLIDKCKTFHIPDYRPTLKYLTVVILRMLDTWHYGSLAITH